MEAIPVATQLAGEVVDALVVGAGPTGLTMASELVRHGLSCRLVDQAPGPSKYSKALVVQARTLEVFDMMGLVDWFVDAGQPMRALNIYLQGRQIARIAFDGLDSPYPYPLIIEQSETERILAENLARQGLTAERQITLSDFTAGADVVEATLRHADGRTESVRARWLLGCDGAHSTVRHVLKLPFEGAPYHEDFILGDVRLDWPMPSGEGHGFLAKRELLVALPMRGEHRFRLIARREGNGVAAGQDPTVAEFQALLDREAGSLSGKVSDPVWLASFHLHRRIVPELRQGRVFLAGDAAHIHSPAGGQGMNTGIQDAFNLAWKIALVQTGAGQPVLLDSYQAERHPVAESVLRNTDRMFRFALGESVWLRLVRQWLAPLLFKQEWLQRRLRGFVSELDLNYRESPIVDPKTDAAFRAGLHPGDRAPDVTLVAAGTNTPVPLFELWRGTRHTLILCGTAADLPRLETIRRAIPERHAALLSTLTIISGPDGQAGTPASGNGSVVLDPDRSFPRAYGAESPCLFLVRPDGYLAFCGWNPDAGRLNAYLDRIFL
jgi:2-polyprenyl-6-methoxyphenol hydroxylase-like FAD-dependent oxidoreductase